MSFPNSKRGFNGFLPYSITNSFEGNMVFAKEFGNKGVERVADQMGLASHHVLYKWLSNGRMPAILIRPFENACGISLVTKYIAYSAHKIVIDIPTGRKATARDINDLQSSLTQAVSELLRFYDGKSNMEDTVSAIQQSLENLAWHKGEVEKYSQPELDLEEFTE